MLIKNTNLRRIVSLLFALCLLFCLVPTAAFADNLVDIEYTQDRNYSVEIGYIVGTNNGYVRTNNGTIQTNDKVFFDSYGNYKSGGYVETNKGIVKNNVGTVQNNNEGGTVEKNEGTVGKNYGNVSLNEGTVTENFGKVDNHMIGEVTYNFGTVSNGYVKYNFGTVSNGYVTYNCGTVKDRSTDYFCFYVGIDPTVLADDIQSGPFVGPSIPEHGVVYRQDLEGTYCKLWGVSVCNLPSETNTLKSITLTLKPGYVPYIKLGNGEIESLGGNKYKITTYGDNIELDVKYIGTSVPATADMSNVPLWSALLLVFAATAILTRKKKNG